VRGDIVSIAGEGAGGADVRGGVTEVSLQDAAINPLAAWLGGFGVLSFVDGLGGAVPR
jgi:hypothetical protein